MAAVCSADEFLHLVDHGGLLRCGAAALQHLLQCTITTCGLTCQMGEVADVLGECARLPARAAVPQSPSPDAHAHPPQPRGTPGRCSAMPRRCRARARGCPGRSWLPIRAPRRRPSRRPAAARSRPRSWSRRLVSEDAPGRPRGDALRRRRDRLEAGDEVYYTIRVRNPGKEPVTDIVVTKRMPFGVHYVARLGCGPGLRRRVLAPTTARRTSPRAARPREYTHVRWTLPAAARARCDRAAALPRHLPLTVATDLADIFGPDGPLARALPGYGVREQQSAMAEHVAAALEEPRDAGRRGRHGHGQDLRLPRAGAGVGAARDRLDRHARAAGPALSPRPAGGLRARSAARCGSRC